MLSAITSQKLTCYHCGDDCSHTAIRLDDKVFCCEGCRMVFELLSENNLCTYYQLNAHQGNKPAGGNLRRLSWLDDESVVAHLLSFSERNVAVINFSVPQMHCTACIWLLESLPSMQEGILHAYTDFLKKEVSITFNNGQITLRQVVEKLASIGYEPDLRMSDLQKKMGAATDRSLYYKIGVAGFCFGNIMMLSFPEYLAGVSHIDPILKQFFSYLNLVLALPVFFYSAADYFVKSWKAARIRYFSIDLPIALGLAAMLLRSMYEILSGTGAGYLDSMTGLVFFLLIGRYFQSLTYNTLSFERDYKSYFPVATTVKKNGQEIPTPISHVQPGDKIIIHSDELIPADALLLNGQAHIDYSFVTGESIPVTKNTGDLLYAGGRQKGAAIELQVKKTVEQSYLTQLWNHEAFQKNKQVSLSLLADTISKYFTIAILAIAAVTALYWFPRDIHRCIMACTSILIIACPCALAITVPFTFGNIMQVLGRNSMYLKNAAVVESIAEVNTIIFDKTGTATMQHTGSLRFEGAFLSGLQKVLVRSLASQSIHPLSKKITDSLTGIDVMPVCDFVEIPGAGIKGTVNGAQIRMGSASFMADEMPEQGSADPSATRVYVSIDHVISGCFIFSNSLRDGFEQEIHRLQHNYQLFLLSGDQDGDREKMEGIFPVTGNLFFRQSPEDKLQFVRQQQMRGNKVMMIGDGLNDAGALKQSDAGIAISDDLVQFSPACDAILKGSEFCKLSSLITLCKSGTHIIWFTFFISLLYNIIGVAYAVQGQLSPMVAAVLMPLSSISVIVITTLATKWKASRLGL